MFDTKEISKYRAILERKKEELLELLNLDDWQKIKLQNVQNALTNIACK